MGLYPGDLSSGLNKADRAHRMVAQMVDTDGLSLRTQPVEAVAMALYGIRLLCEKLRIPWFDALAHSTAMWRQNR